MGDKKGKKGKGEFDELDEDSAGFTIGPGGIQKVDAPKSAAGIKEWDLFINSIQRGVGLSTACNISGNDIATVSAKLRKHKDLLDILKAWDYAYMSSLVKELMGTGDSRRYYLAVHTGINLWEQECKKGAANFTMVAKAYVKYRQPREIATVCGLTYDEYVEFVIANAEVIKSTLAITGINPIELL